MTEDEIKESLQRFTPISLSEMDDLKLMNRLDNKFVFSINELGNVLRQAAEHYRVLEINGQREFFYLTKYMDTPDWFFFSEHQKGHADRYKIRMRTYEVNQQSYLEIKHKTNKGQTKKSRIKISNTDGLDDECRRFIEEKTHRQADNLNFVSINGFNRITLASFETHERITIDHNLSFSYEGKSIKLNRLCIAEVKKERSSMRTPIIDIMKNVHGLNTGLSKYCIGISYLHEDLKQNAFKPKKLLINKIERNEYFAN